MKYNIDKNDSSIFFSFFFFNKKLNIFNKQNALISSVKFQKKYFQYFIN